MKTILLSLALLIIFISGCNNDSVTNGNNSGAVTYYELPIGSDSSLSHYYGLAFTENSGTVTGTTEIFDTISKQSGTLSGTVNGNSYLLNAGFGNNQYDFGFSGTKSNNFIGGKLVFTHSSLDTHNVALLYSSTKVLNYGDSASTNPYLLTTVFTTPNPTGPPVIFVHGMGTTIAEWDSLFISLDAGFKSRHNVYAYQYNWKDSIMINGRILKDSVTSRGLVNPILVAHSMGGLVSRAYIASGGQITKLVTLGTPHTGTPLANVLFIRPDLDTPGPQDMKPQGHFITSMLVNSLDIANRDKYYCIAGEMGGHFETTYPFSWVWNEPYYKSVMNGMVCTGWKLLLPYGKNDGLVPLWSAFFEGSNGVHLPFPTPQLYVDHMHLVGPQEAPVISNYINAL